MSVRLMGQLEASGLLAVAKFIQLVGGISLVCLIGIAGLGVFALGALAVGVIVGVPQDVVALPAAARMRGFQESKNSSKCGKGEAGRQIVIGLSPGGYSQSGTESSAMSSS